MSHSKYKEGDKIPPMPLKEFIKQREQEREVHEKKEKQGGKQ